MRSVFCKYFLLFLSRLLVLPMASLAVRKLSGHLFAFGLKSKTLVARPVSGLSGVRGSAVSSGVLQFLVSP